jgi:hypothetical protein
LYFSIQTHFFLLSFPFRSDFFFLLIVSVEVLSLI